MDVCNLQLTFFLLFFCFVCGITFSLGNLDMITKEGGLHTFLLQHHKKFGAIFNFYWGKELVVSLGAPQLFKDVQMLFD